MRSRLLIWFALATLFLMAGCERSDTSVLTVEGDEPGYRRGIDLKKQGRNQEALNEFLKVVEKRGLDNAPESHLELGMLYQFHIKDPIKAIFHYQKFRELKPNSPQADLVRQRIDSATRDFARTIPLLPLENDLQKLDMSDLVGRLKSENEKLKADLAAARANRPAPAADTEAAATEDTPTQAPPARTVSAPSNEVSPVQRATVETAPAPSPVAPVRQSPPTAPPSRPTPSVATTPRSTTPANTRPTNAGGYRRHVIAKGDTLYSLALKYYGNRSRWRDIYAANKDVMRSPDDYKIGMELKIPQ